MFIYLMPFVVIFFIFFAAEPTIKTESIIEGKQETYVGKEIKFYTYSDPFTGNDSVIGSCTVDSLGNFRVTLSVSDTTLIYSYLGIYKGYLYVVPNMLYVIDLPDWYDKSPADKLNPFFQPIEFIIGVKNNLDQNFNYYFQQFDSVYYSLLKKYINPLKTINSQIVDSIQQSLQQYVPDFSTKYYKNYVKYKFGLFQYLIWHQRVRSISRNYFEKKPILYNNMAYFDLFNAVYDKYFYFFGQSPKGKKIFEIINSEKSYFKLFQLLQNDSILKDSTLCELVILKNIYSEFYASNFSRSGLLAVLDTLISQTKIDIHRNYGIKIRDKITRLMPNYYPPDFQLYDKDKKLTKLSDFRGKYIYLNFCSCVSYACMKEFDVLGRIAEKFYDKLIILTISTDDHFENMLHYANNGHSNWLFLHFGEYPDIIKDYDIRGYPTYYLIAPDGKLIFSPAKSPAEYFELELFKVMRSRGDL